MDACVYVCVYMCVCVCVCAHVHTCMCDVQSPINILNLVHGLEFSSQNVLLENVEL